MSRLWIAGLLLVSPFGAAPLQAQWTIAMRPMQNPLAVGQCTAIEIVVKDPSGMPPVRPNGKQLDWQDFELSFITSAPDAFAWKNESHRFLCAQAPTASTAVVIARYPGGHLRPEERIAGVEVQQTVEVAMQGAPPSGAPAGPPPPAYAGPTPAYGPSAAPAAPDRANGYPQPVAAAPAPAYPQPASYPQGSGYAQPVAAAPDAGNVRTGKQFLERITGHAKRKASEVASSTTTQVADAAGDVVGTTLETGSDVVKSGTGAVTGAASKSVQGVGQSLGVVASPRDPADVAAALAQGRAVLHGLHFTEGTAILEPSSGPLISQIAGALARTPGQFLIEAHVDGKNPAAAQALSEQRAAAVKAALVAAGTSPMQLAAVGYGATRPLAGAKASARIEIARTQ